MLDLCELWAKGRHTERPILALLFLRGIAIGHAGLSLDQTRLTWFNRNILSIGLYSQCAPNNDHKLVKGCDLGWFVPGRRGKHMSQAKSVLTSVQHAEMFVNDFSIFAWKDTSMLDLLDHDSFLFMFIKMSSANLRGALELWYMDY